MYNNNKNNNNNDNNNSCIKKKKIKRTGSKSKSPRSTAKYYSFGLALK